MSKLRPRKVDNVKEVTQFWQEGNKKLKMGKVDMAIQMYTNAINRITDKICKNPSISDIYNSRSTAFFMEKRYREALKDSIVGVEHSQIIGITIQTQNRIVRCCVILGDTEIGKKCLSKIPPEACNQEQKASLNKFNRLDELKEKVTKHYEMKDYGHVLELTDVAIGISPGAVYFITMKAKCLIYQQREVSQLLNGLQPGSTRDYAMGIYYYCNDNLDLSIQAFQKANEHIPETASWLDQANSLKNAKLNVVDLKLYGGGDLFEARNTILTTLKKRCASRILKENFKGALEDATKILDIDPGHSEATLKLVQCHIALGNMKETEAMLNLNLDPIIRTSYAEKLTKLKDQHILALDMMSKGLYAEAGDVIILALKTSPKSSSLVLLHAECFAMQRKIDVAERLLQTLDKNDVTKSKRNASLVFVQGLCFYYRNRLQLAMARFKMAEVIASANKLQFAKILTKATLFEQRSKAMDEAFKNAETEKRLGNKLKALEYYGVGLAIDTENKDYMLKTHLCRAELNKDIGNYMRAVKDFDFAIDIDPKCYEAWLGRGKAHMVNDNFKEAVSDFEKANKLLPSHETRTNLKYAKKKMKTQDKKTHYGVLGISRDANEKDIKKAYRKKAKEFHPDKHMNASDDDRQKMEAIMKEISAAQRCLSDPKLKRKYDLELDQDEDENRSSSDQDMNDYSSGEDSDDYYPFNPFFRNFMGRGNCDCAYCGSYSDSS